MKLTASSKALATRLLAWDRARVAQRRREGYDVEIYAARQDLALACLEIDADDWPEEVRFLFMAVLEITRTPTIAKEAGIGQIKTTPVRLTPTQKEEYRELAREIGVLGRLQEVAPRSWAEGALV